MRTFAKSTIVGNLGRDAEARQTQSGKPTVTLSVAVDDKWNRETRSFDGVNYFRVVVYGERNCEFAKTLKKGEPVYIEAEIKPRQYDKDGMTKEITEFVVSEFRGEVNVLSRTKDRAGEPSAAPSRSTGRTARVVAEDPF